MFGSVPQDLWASLSAGTTDTASSLTHCRLCWTQLFQTQTLFKWIVIKRHLALAWAGGTPPSASCLLGCPWEGGRARRWPSSCGPHFCGALVPRRHGQAAITSISCSVRGKCFWVRERALCSSNMLSLKLLDSSLNPLPFLDSGFWEPKPRSPLIFPCVCVIPSLSRGHRTSYRLDWGEAKGEIHTGS